MTCPACESARTVLIDAVTRKHGCDECGHTWREHGLAPVSENVKPSEAQSSGELSAAEAHSSGEPDEDRIDALQVRLAKRAAELGTDRLTDEEIVQMVRDVREGGLPESATESRELPISEPVVGDSEGTLPPCPKCDGRLEVSSGRGFCSCGWAGPIPEGTNIGTSSVGGTDVSESAQPEGRLSRHALANGAGVCAAYGCDDDSDPAFTAENGVRYCPNHGPKSPRIPDDQLGPPEGRLSPSDTEWEARRRQAFGTCNSTDKQGKRCGQPKGHFNWHTFTEDGFGVNPAPTDTNTVTTDAIPHTRADDE